MERTRGCLYIAWFCLFTLANEAGPEKLHVANPSAESPRTSCRATYEYYDGALSYLIEPVCGETRSEGNVEERPGGEKMQAEYAMRSKVDRFELQ